ncbi:hypothetical protein JRQ81_003214 [Phrynocephalus forsythii]|uniref:Uncharacterized protein n=1 Tax=Phrynocephalus forsythii TaxID=171643 RepID=A0A9Q0XMN5_9SAUR|nr:hypothetical protein JRQ81_003214 [Phrynocephalus forsythii]
MNCYTGEVEEEDDDKEKELLCGLVQHPHLSSVYPPLQNEPSWTLGVERDDWQSLEMHLPSLTRRKCTTSLPGQPAESRLGLSQGGLVEEYRDENECQQQELVDDEEGSAVQERDIQLGRAPGVSSSSISIRRLLCDNAACALCERTAMEAVEVVRIQQIAPGIPPLPQPPLPATSYVERSSLPAVCTLRDSAPFPPASTSEPKASCSIWQTPLSQEGLEEKPPPPRTALVCRLWGRSPHPQSQPSHQEEENSDNSEETRDQQEEEEEHFFISSAGTSMQAVTSGEESSPSSCLTRSSSRNWKDRTHFRHHKTSLRRRGLEQASCWSDSEGSSESQDEGHWDNSVLRKQRRRFLSSSREASAVASSGTLQSPRSAFPAGQTPFVSDATRETLEWHMAVKRVQHGLGLPSSSLSHSEPFSPWHQTPLFTQPPRVKSWW